MDFSINPRFCGMDQDSPMPDSYMLCLQNQHMSGTSGVGMSVYPRPPTMNSTYAPYGNYIQSPAPSMNSINRPLGYPERPSVECGNGSFGNAYQTRISDTSGLANPFQSYTGQPMMQRSQYQIPAPIVRNNNGPANYHQTPMRFDGPPGSFLYGHTFSNPSGSLNTAALTSNSRDDDYPERFALSPLGPSGRSAMPVGDDNFPEPFALSPPNGSPSRNFMPPRYGDYRESYALPPQQPHPRALPPKPTVNPEPYDSEQDAEFELDDSPPVLMADVDTKTASSTPAQNQFDPSRKSKKFSIARKESSRNSESEESKPKPVFRDRKINKRYFDNDPIVVDAPEMDDQESEPALSDAEPDEPAEVPGDLEQPEPPGAPEEPGNVEDSEGSVSDTLGGEEVDYDAANAVCAICSGEQCPDGNDIVFCDQCNLAAHQRCYGISVIPTGSWYCRDCKPLQMKDKQTADQSASSTTSSTTQSPKRKRSSEDDDEEQESTHSSKRTRSSSSSMSNDEEPQRSSHQPPKRKRINHGSTTRMRNASVLILDDIEEEMPSPPTKKVHIHQ